jgi:hypothetical protein
MKDAVEVVYELIAHAQGALALMQANDKVDVDGAGNLSSAERLLYSVLRKAHMLREILDRVPPVAPTVSTPAPLKSVAKDECGVSERG